MWNYRGENRMTKIFTNYKISIKQTFTFWGEGNSDLDVDDLVYIWQDRSKQGLGDEIIYGTAKIIKVLQNNYFVAERIV